MADAGIGNDTTVVLYGDNNNWFAAWALWQMKIYGHKDVRLMNGGRKKWLAEGRELTTDAPELTPDELPAPPARTSSCAPSCAEVMEASRSRTKALVDVRSPDEFTGEILAPPGLPETCQRGGHIPGAASIPWGQAVQRGRHLQVLRRAARRSTAARASPADKPVIAYCRIGERSSHTWFVLKYLLGYDEREELRRLLDRVGQPGRRPGRARRLKGSASPAGRSA